MEIDFPQPGFRAAPILARDRRFLPERGRGLRRTARTIRRPPGAGRSRTHPRIFSRGISSSTWDPCIGRYMRVLEIESGKTECLDIRYGGGDHLSRSPRREVRSRRTPLRSSTSSGARRGRGPAEKAAQAPGRGHRKVYAARQLAKGFTFPPDKPWQKEMEASFLYQEELTAPCNRRGQGGYGGAAPHGSHPPATLGSARRRIRALAFKPGSFVPT